MDEAIPFLGGGVQVTGSKSGTKMIIVCEDHTLGRVAEMSVLRDKLKVNFLFVEAFFHCVGALVVEDAESGSCTILM